MTARLEVVPGRPLVGRLRVPGDKSISHRALLLGAKADGTSVVRGLSDGDDVRRTAAAMEEVGARIERDGSGASLETRITGGPTLLHEPTSPLDVGNSG